MSAAESRVTGIVQSLAKLEDGMDSLNSKVADMKKQLAADAQAEIDSLLAGVKKEASREAEAAIADARSRATAESEKVAKAGEERLAEINSKIEANFDQAVSHVVSTVLKA